MLGTNRDIDLSNQDREYDRLVRVGGVSNQGRINKRDYELEKDRISASFKN